LSVSTEPSEVARAIAAGMRAFDERLSDDQLDAIARGIDGQRALGALLAPKKKPLPNAVEPLTAVRIPPTLA
jgi:hypothetical protein